MNLFRSASFGAVLVTLIFSVPAGAAEIALISSGAVWRYEATGTDLGNIWEDVGYPDDGWLLGPAQLGYGDGYEATVLPSTTVLPCYYYRHHSTVTNPAQYDSLSLGVLVDDGCVVYLNGQEVKRSGIFYVP